MNNKSYVYALLLVLCAFSAPSAWGQNNNADKHFRLVYIAHESKTLIGKNRELCEHLISLNNNAEEMGSALIVYLANGDAPLISLTNLNAFTKTVKGDSVVSFDDITQELQSWPNLEVNAEHDRENLMWLLTDKFKLWNDAGTRMLFKSVTIDFYVGPDFWAHRYNEAIIARLFVNLGMKEMLKKYPQTQLQYNVWKANGDTLPYVGAPFGKKNADDINNIVRINEY